MIYKFGQFSLDMENLELTGEDGLISLEPQVSGLLGLLVENRDRIISKNEIFEKIWDGRIVSDGILNTRLSAVRQAVGDNGKAQKIIRIFPRRGIRFVADIQQEGFHGEGQTAALDFPAQPSIAVIPLENLSGDQDQDYFSDGITEDIITALSNIQQFFVIARNSSFYFKDKKVDARDVAADFGVRYILQGSVQKSGDQVRISAQLVDGQSGNNMWAERYDRNLKEIFSLQDEITANIVGCIAPELRLAEAKRASELQDDNLAAWDLLQKGNYHFYRWSREDFIEAKKWYELAIDMDPEFVPAYSALTELCFVDSIWHFSSDHERANEQSVLLGRKAIELDRGNAMAHCALGRALMGQGMKTGKFDHAVASLEHALSINRNHAAAHYHLGRTLTWSGNSERNRQHLGEAMRLSPRDPFMGLMMAGMAEAYFLEGELETSIEWFAKATQSLPNLTWVARSTYVAALALLEKTEEAQIALDNLLELAPAFTSAWVKDEFNCAFQNNILDGLAKAGMPKG